MNNKESLELANFVLKPNWFYHRDFIINKFKDDFINIAWDKKTIFSEEIIKILYWENLPKDIFKAMNHYLLWKETIIGLVLDKNAHKKLITSTWKETDWENCNKGSIRNLFTKKVIVNGIEIIDNAIHRSKDADQAYRDMYRINTQSLYSDTTLYGILNQNNPFSSFRNNIDVNSDWDILKKYINIDNYYNELRQIQFLQWYWFDFLPTIKESNPNSWILTFKYEWRKVNKDWDPGMILNDRELWFKLAWILWNLHKIKWSTNTNKELNLADISKVINTYNIDKKVNYSWIDFLWFKHWDFTLNNILKNNNIITVIDWELSGFWSQNIDIIKLFRSVLLDIDLTNNMIDIYNESLWEDRLSYQILMKLFMDSAIENLIKQDASWPKLTQEERIRYRNKLNTHCIENIQSILHNNKIKHIEF
mgnify:CR=1 FL=1